MSKYCSHCYGDFSKSWYQEWEATGFCLVCVTHNPQVRQMATDDIARRPIIAEKKRQMDALLEAWKNDDRADATTAATLLVPADLETFIGRCENVVRSLRYAYEIPRFGFGGKDTSDVLSMLTSIGVLKSAMFSVRDDVIIRDFFDCAGGEGARA